MRVNSFLLRLASDRGVQVQVDNCTAEVWHTDPRVNDGMSVICFTPQKVRQVIYRLAIEYQQLVGTH